MANPMEGGRARNPLGSRLESVRRAGWRRPVVAGAAVALAAFPVVRMFALLRHVSPMPYGDYWLMLPGLVDDDGRPVLSNLFERHNEHPLAFAKALYLVVLELFDGSNAALAFLVFVVGILQLVLIGALLHRSSLTLAAKAPLFVVSSALLFSLNGAWNYEYSMSGAAWLTANVAVLAAVFLRHRDRYWESMGVGVLATLAYGTGQAVWLALLATGLTRRPRREWWKEGLPVALFGVAELVRRSEAAERARREGLPDWGFDPARILEDAQHLVEFAAGIETGRHTLGLVVLLVTVALGAWTVLRQVEDAAGLVGVAVYGVASCAFIAYGRPGFFGGQMNRYQSLPAFVWIGAVALALRLGRDPLRRAVASRGPLARNLVVGAVAVVLSAPIAWGALRAGMAHREQIEDGRTHQAVGAIAVRLGIDDDLAYLMRIGTSPAPISLLQKVGQYPFSPRWDDDCGMLGIRLDLSSMEVVPGGGIESGSMPDQLEGDGVELSGRVPADLEWSCVLVVGDDGEVVGAGVSDRWVNRFRTSSDKPVAVLTVALAGQESYSLVVVSPQGTAVALAGKLDAFEIPGH
jgi:hypothetical protein